MLVYSYDLIQEGFREIASTVYPMPNFYFLFVLESIPNVWVCGFMIDMKFFMQAKHRKCNIRYNSRIDKIFD